MGSLAHRANAQTTAAVKSAVPGNLVRECTEMIAKESPKTRIVGKFFLAARSKNRAGTIDRLLDPGVVVALAAPTTNITVFGAKLRAYAGCTYYVRNGTLSFRKLGGPNFFPRRYKLEPGED
jgi:hypothetical protein